MEERFRVLSSYMALEKGYITPDDYYTREGYYYCILFDFKDPENPVEIARDGGEPEDQTLFRDWAWVPVVMNKLAKGEM